MRCAAHAVSGNLRPEDSSHPHWLNDAFGVPEDDGGDREVEARGTVAPVFEGAVADLAVTMEKQRTSTPIGRSKSTWGPELTVASLSGNLRATQPLI
jgi:hypothetical protein